MSVKSLQGRRTENTLLVLSYTMPILHQPRLKLRTKCVVAGVKHKSPKQCWNLGDQSHRLSLSLLGASSADIGSRSTSQSNTVTATNGIQSLSAAEFIADNNIPTRTSTSSKREANTESSSPGVDSKNDRTETTQTIPVIDTRLICNSVQSAQNVNVNT